MPQDNDPTGHTRGRLRVGLMRPLRLDAPTVATMRGRAVLSTLGIGVQGGLRFISSVLVGRIGGDAVLGVVNSAISAAMFLTLLGPQSTGNAASKFVARARGSGRYDDAQRVAVHLGRRTLLLGLLLAIIGILSWAGVSGDPLGESWPEGLCVAALVVGYSGYSFVRGLHFGAGQVPRATAWDVTSVVIGLAGLLVLLASGVRSTALLLPFAFAYCVYTVVGWPHAVSARMTSANGMGHVDAASSSPERQDSGQRRLAAGASSGESVTPDRSSSQARLSAPVDVPAGTLEAAAGRLDPGLRREIDHFVLFGVAGAIAVTGFLQLSMVVARLVDSDSQAGQYAAALSLATPASLLAGSMSLVLFPSMAEAWGRGDRAGFRRQGDHAMRLLVLLMVAVFGVLVLVSRPLVRVVYGPDYAHAAGLLPWLLLAVLAISVGVGAVTSLTTRSQRGVALSSAASAAGLLAGGIVWAAVAPGQGVRGVAIGYLVGTVIGTVVPVVLVWRQDQQRWLGLLVRAAVAVGVLLTLLWMEHRVGVSPFTVGSAGGRWSAWWLDPICAAVFLVAWLVLSWSDARRLVPLLVLRRR